LLGAVMVAWGAKKHSYASGARKIKEKRVANLMLPLL